MQTRQDLSIALFLEHWSRSYNVKNTCVILVADSEHKISFTSLLKTVLDATNGENSRYGLLGSNCLRINRVYLKIANFTRIIFLTLTRTSF